MLLFLLLCCGIFQEARLILPGLVDVTVATAFGDETIQLARLAAIDAEGAAVGRLDVAGLPKELEGRESVLEREKEAVVVGGHVVAGLEAGLCLRVKMWI